MTRPRLWLALGIVGAPTLVLFDHPATLAAGVLLLVAWIGWGAWLLVGGQD